MIRIWVSLVWLRLKALLLSLEPGEALFDYTPRLSSVSLSLLISWAQSSSYKGLALLSISLFVLFLVRTSNWHKFYHHFRLQLFFLGPLLSAQIWSKSTQPYPLLTIELFLIDLIKFSHPFLYFLSLLSLSLNPFFYFFLFPHLFSSLPFLLIQKEWVGYTKWIYSLKFLFWLLFLFVTACFILLLSSYIRQVNSKWMINIFSERSLYLCWGTSGLLGELPKMLLTPAFVIWVVFPLNLSKKLI